MQWIGTPRVSPLSSKKRKKQKIPVAFREQIWIRTIGKEFEGKCPTRWCQNRITVFDFQSGHNIPESKGGPTIPDNLIPLCSRCNMSMGDRYTFDQWSALNPSMATCPPSPTLVGEGDSNGQKSWISKIFCCS
jgi:5-methylcytosine-specific restriction endonuclease McrA